MFGADSKMIPLLEVKSTQTLWAADKRQLLNHLRCTAFSIGILFHFGPRPEFHRFMVPTSHTGRRSTLQLFSSVPRCSRQQMGSYGSDQPDAASEGRGTLRRTDILRTRLPPIQRPIELRIPQND